MGYLLFSRWPLVLSTRPRGGGQAFLFNCSCNRTLWGVVTACVTGPSGELYLGQVQRPSQCQAGQTLPDKPRGFGKPGEKQPKVAWLSSVHGCGIPTAPQGQSTGCLT